MKALFAGLATLSLTALAVVSATAQAIVVTGQLLAYQQGFVFFTTGDGFRAAPNVVVTDAKTGKPTPMLPAPRLYARATFDAQGEIVALALSRTPLPQEGDFSQVRQFAVALSSPVPNPDLNQPASSIQLGTRAVEGSGRPVVVVFDVQVPPGTPLDAPVYMTTDTSGWNPQAIPMQRIDALHFRVVERLAVGTVMHYLFTRGSFASEERTAGGLDPKPRIARVLNVDDQVYNNVVYRWADQNVPGSLLQPNVFPTPFNPAPFPNLPPGIHTPAPR
jgi:hypothetical protein